MNNVYVKIYANVIDSGAHDQIKLIATSPAVTGLIAIMPDVHKGAGCVIGFTGLFNKQVIPNLIGVDIGCGVIAYPLEKKEIDFKELDEYIRANIPLGFSKRDLSKKEEFVKELENNITIKKINIVAKDITKKYDCVLNQIGTLGGGNHFIEIGENPEGEKYLLIHSGSRNIGKQIADFYQKKAKDICKAMQISTPQGLEYLPLEYGGNNYLVDMELAQQFASLNRKVMLKIILRYFGIKFKEEDLIESVHNYI